MYEESCGFDYDHYLRDENGKKQPTEYDGFSPKGIRKRPVCYKMLFTNTAEEREKLFYTCKQ